MIAELFSVYDRLMELARNHERLAVHQDSNDGVIANANLARAYRHSANLLHIKLRLDQLEGGNATNQEG